MRAPAATRIVMTVAFADTDLSVDRIARIAGDLGTDVTAGARGGHLEVEFVTDREPSDVLDQLSQRVGPVYSHGFWPVAEAAA